jgi:tellurite resistance protein TehA-like permease
VFSAARPRTGILGAVEHLPPGYFALVMATGIVAIAWHLQGFTVVPAVLGALNWVAYVTLWVLTLTRIVLFPNAVARDLSDHLRGAGFYTIIAGTSVLGTQTIVIEQASVIGEVLWYVTIALWIAIMYSFLVTMAVTVLKPTLERAINGGWLVAVVSTQSVAVLGAAAGASTEPPEVLQFMCLGFFLVGLLLYLIIIALIFYRTFFVQMTAKEFGPLYWIDTGAAAISTLAGSTLLLRAAAWPVLAHYVPFLEGATLFVWTAATFWLPFLFAMTVWRYGVRRDQFRYEPGLWGMVFPLGMYSAATFELARAEGLVFLDPLAQAFAFVALAAWLLTAGTFVATLISRQRAPDRRELG